MAYFLKKSYLKKGLYLQIYESFYHHDKKQTAHRSFKALGYVSDILASGIDDPVTHFTNVVAQMNGDLRLSKHNNREKQIASSPEKHVGYFLVKAVLDGLKVSNYLDLLQTSRSFKFRIANLIDALVFSRVTKPCSKNKTLLEVLPSLYNQYELSYDQILEGIEFIGGEYEKIIEIFNHQLQLKYPVNTATTYFDCTNFYFEIDREDEFRRKGPSKENRKDPIVGLGLLLDAHQVPIGMKLFPGNESERPVLRQIVQELKDRNHITGRTVQVADKGLNCTNNILAARKNGDGYLFSKSVKMLPATEKTWVLLGNDYREVWDEKGTLLYKIKECVDTFPYEFVNESGKKVTVRLTEKRVVTFNPSLAAKKRFEINRIVEKAKALKASQAKRNEFGECGKYITFTPVDKKGDASDGKIAITMNQEAIDEDLRLAGYNLLVTSETGMDAGEIYAVYHNLWRIEESFKLMKSYLDARPVYLHKTESICGHFLICYLSVLLIRILQLHEFKNQYSTETLMSFIRRYRIVKIEHNKYINITPSSEFIMVLSERLALPLSNYFLRDAHIKEMLNLKF